jgi:hypothetical protein
MKIKFLEDISFELKVDRCGFSGEYGIKTVRFKKGEEYEAAKIELGQIRKQKRRLPDGTKVFDEIQHAAIYMSDESLDTDYPNIFALEVKQFEILDAWEIATT